MLKDERRMLMQAQRTPAKEKRRKDKDRNPLRVLQSMLLGIDLLHSLLATEAFLNGGGVALEANYISDRA